MIEFADWSGLEIRLVYYPPHRSKYNPVERCWSSLQQKWNGVLLTCWQVVKHFALRMKWKGQPPVTKKEMDYINSRIKRSEKLPKYDLVIKTEKPRGR